jgi:hypothetical protein
MSDRRIFVQRFKVGIEIAKLSWLDIRNVKAKKLGKSIPFGNDVALSSMKPPRLAIICEIVSSALSGVCGCHVELFYLGELLQEQVSLLINVVRINSYPIEDVF